MSLTLYGKKFIEVKALAEGLMIENNLCCSKWQFQFDGGKRRAGCCFYPNKFRTGRISLSKYYVDKASYEDIKDTILHEIAHAIAGPYAGHGYHWKTVCLQIGAKPNRCYDSNKIEMPKGKWKANCPSCNKEYRKHRLHAKNRYHYCPKCGSIEGKLTFYSLG